MIEKTISKPVRLDVVVQEFYGTLKVFDKVLKSNNHLATKIILEIGDIVNLPVIEVEQIKKEDEVLW